MWSSSFLLSLSFLLLLDDDLALSLSSIATSSSAAMWSSSFLLDEEDFLVLVVSVAFVSISSTRTGTTAASSMSILALSLVESKSSISSRPFHLPFLLSLLVLIRFFLSPLSFFLFFLASTGVAIWHRRSNDMIMAAMEMMDRRRLLRRQWRRWWKDVAKVNISGAEFLWIELWVGYEFVGYSVSQNMVRVDWIAAPEKKECEETMSCRGRSESCKPTTARHDSIDAKKLSRLECVVVARVCVDTRTWSTDRPSTKKAGTRQKLQL